MRLEKPEEIKKIIRSFDEKAVVYLFGSRADDSKKGGDIDLLVLSSHIDIKEKLKIKLELYKLLGEQKIDIIIKEDTEDPFVKMALKTGIKL